MSSQPVIKCVFCEQPLDQQLVREGGTFHPACCTAYGLDYNPKSEADANEFLARYRKRTGGQDDPQSI